MNQPVEVQIGKYLGFAYIDAEKNLVFKITGVDFTDRLRDQLLSSRPQITKF